MSCWFVGISMAKHVKGVTGVVLTQGVDDAIPCPYGRSQRVEQDDRIPAPFLDEMHVTGGRGNCVCKITAYEHWIPLFMDLNKQANQARMVPTTQRSVNLPKVSNRQSHNLTFHAWYGRSGPANEGV